MDSARTRVAYCTLAMVFLAACGAQVTPASPSATAAPPTSILQPTGTPLPTITSTTEPTLTPTTAFAPSPTPWIPGNLGPIAYITNDYYAGKDEIRLVNPAAFEFQTIYTTASNSLAYSLSWSPDGQSIAFVQEYSCIGVCPKGDIFILDVANIKTRNLTNTPDVYERDLAWSPDGKKIAYVVSTHDARNIYVMDVDGSNIRQLTDCATFCEQPAWSPAGESIAYMSDFHIFVMNADGSNSRQVTQGGVNMRPAWSPDGKQIAFIRAASTSLESTRYLYVMRPDGSNPIALDSDAPFDEQITWSPDGRFIAFKNSGYNKDQGISIVDIQSGMTRLVAGGLAYAPAWQPILVPVFDPSLVNALPDCTSGRTQLTAGAQARVLGSEGDTPNRVRSAPVIADNVIYLLSPGSVMQVTEGPVCADGLVFWKVWNIGIPGGYGWTAEGDGKQYWLIYHLPQQP